MDNRTDEVTGRLADGQTDRQPECISHFHLFWKELKKSTTLFLVEFATSIEVENDEMNSNYMPSSW